MQFSLCLLKCPWLCAGSNVQIPGEVVILNSVVLPDKELYASYKNQIILWPLDVAYSAYKDVIKTGGWFNGASALYDQFVVSVKFADRSPCVHSTSRLGVARWSRRKIFAQIYVFVNSISW